MIGAGLMITPVLEEGERKVKGYFPAGSWFNIDAEKKYNVINETIGVWSELDAQIDYIHAHVRGGHIIPIQAAANTTQFARLNPFSLYVAPDKNGEAQGELFYDDGESQSLEKYFHAKFILKEKKLSMNIVKNEYQNMANLKLDEIRIFFRDEIKDFEAKQITPAPGLLPTLNVGCLEQFCDLNNLGLKMNEPFEFEFNKV